jgi:hypothetical protein
MKEECGSSGSREGEYGGSGLREGEIIYDIAAVGLGKLNMAEVDRGVRGQLPGKLLFDRGSSLMSHLVAIHAQQYNVVAAVALQVQRKMSTVACRYHLVPQIVRVLPTCHAPDPILSALRDRHKTPLSLSWRNALPLH